jgi:MYXO-CTERM domain-containing protein
MSTAPAIPGELADIVLALHNTHDFYPRPTLRAAKAHGKAQVAPQTICTAPGCGVSLALAPLDWAQIYDVTPLFESGVAGSPVDGSGVTIAIVGLSEIAQSDIATFRQNAGLPATTIAMTLVPDTGDPQSANGAGEEAIIDTEWSGGIAPGATIHYVFNGADDANIAGAAFYAIEENIAPILSESFGGCEGSETPSDADILGVFGSAANLLGMTYLASSGDQGAAGCTTDTSLVPGLYVNMPASFPGVTGVGGTEFLPGTITYDSSGLATGYGTPEYVWNDSNLTGRPTGGGGGISIVFGRPSYQSLIPTCAIVGSLPLNVNPSTMRQVPDVALTASADETPYLIECTQATTATGGTDCSGTGGDPVPLEVGGTSASAPSFAGVLALVIEATGGQPLGNVNPLLYALNVSAPSAFHDITQGYNAIACTPGSDPGCSVDDDYGYFATTGYDCASGLGSVDAFNLVSAWVTLTPTTTTIAPSPTTTEEGSSVSLTATVDVAGTHASALGGTVIFTFQSYDATGAPQYSWTLGSNPISGGTASTGTAALSAVLPVGLVNPSAQYVDVVAMYGGDAQHLASTSAKVRVSFTGIDLCIPQDSETVQPDGAIAYSAQGGLGQITWNIGYDSTCDSNGDCSTIDPTTGAFTAGPEAGYVVVRAVDSDSALARSFVTVGSPGGTLPWGTQTPTPCTTAPADAGATDGSTTKDSASPVDASAATLDAASTPQDANVTRDAANPRDSSGGGETDSGSSEEGDSATAGAGDGGEGSPSEGKGGSGCSCTTGGRDRSPAGALGAVVLGLGVMARRRRREGSDR